MPLVNYASSDSDSDLTLPPPPVKKLKPHPSKPATTTTTKTSSLPPLPAAFHDLYATSVRTTPTDSPHLHHHRKRTTPHAPGRWPSHLYVEWRPAAAQYSLLSSLISAIRGLLEASDDDDDSPDSPASDFANEDEDVKRILQTETLLPLIESDLGAPLPLHISLSRPLVLTNVNKDSFLSTAKKAIGNLRMAPFTVSPNRISFFTSPDSNRTFVVLNVQTNKAKTSSSSSSSPTPGSKRKASDLSTDDSSINPNPNPQLTTLLTCCNTTASIFHQPPLYSRKSYTIDPTAFHISIAWTFRRPSATVREKVCRLLGGGDFQEIAGWRVLVESIKVKIGNVVTDVPLRVTGGEQRLFV